MTDFLFQYGLFLAKTVTLAAAILLLLGVIFNTVRQLREHAGERLEIKNINERLRHMADTLHDELLSGDEQKRLHKARKAEDKARRRAERLGRAPARARVFVLDFAGDLHASAVETLRQEISALLQVARSDDEILVRLESEGGYVHSYGLAASQLRRVRSRGVRLTVAVDMVAASGGYLMACVADRILAAPFAVVGSIGVIGQLPNFYRLLKKHDVDYELHTAGEFKRTLTVFGENTEAARAKFREELEDTHALFKSFVGENRPQVPIAEVATGEHWFGARALSRKLVDELKTSDDYLLERVKDCDVYEVHFKPHHTLAERLARGWHGFARALGRGAEAPERPLVR